MLLHFNKLLHLPAVCYYTSISCYTLLQYVTRLHISYYTLLPYDTALHVRYYTLLQYVTTLT